MIPLFGMAGTQDSKINVELRTKCGDLLRVISIRKGTNLWVALRRFGIPVGSSCSGVGVCGKCAVQIHPEIDDGINSKSDLENQTIQRQGLAENQRLACLCRLQSNAVVSADYW